MLIKSETGALQPLTSEALCGGNTALSLQTEALCPPQAPSCWPGGLPLLAMTGLPLLSEILFFRDYPQRDLLLPFLKADTSLLILRVFTGPCY